jgi:DNA gyrase inhibitor GyrI
LIKKIVNHDLGSTVKAFVSIYFERVFSLEDNRALSLTGAIVDQEIKATGNIGYRSFPSGRYAVFEHYGPREFMMQAWNAIFLNWLPNSGRLHRDAPTLEIYPRRTTSNNDVWQSCTWLLVPIH